MSGHERRFGLTEKSPQHPRGRAVLVASLFFPKVHNFAKGAGKVSVTSRIKSTTASPTVAPLLPRGSLIYSAAVITKRFGGYQSNLLALERVYGHRRAGAPIFFGSGANCIAHNYFADFLTPDQVLRNHTLFGFYALGLSESVESEWAGQLKVGASLHATRYKRTPVTCHQMHRVDRLRRPNLARIRPWLPNAAPLFPRFCCLDH